MGVLCCCCIGGACCFNSAQTRSLEISLIVLNSISLVLLIICMAVINFKEIYNSNLYFFIIMLLFSIACLIFSIIVRYWDSVGSIKSVQKGTAACLCILGMILSIFFFIACLIEEIIMSISFYRVNYPCYDYIYTSNPYIYRRRISDYDIDCYLNGKDYNIEIISLGQYYLAYVTFSYLEIGLIFMITLWTILKNRIQSGIGAQVIVPNIQPNIPNMIIIQQNVPNYVYQQNIPYVYNQNYSGSNEYQI